MTTCDHCGSLYHADQSTAELRLTYCSGMCESRAIVPISWLLKAERDVDGEIKARIWRRIRDTLATEARKR